MNFSYFTHLDNQDRYLSACLADCMKAERRVRVNPRDTAIFARSALENLFIEQSSIHGIKPANLSDSIKRNCLLLEENNEIIQQKADAIRKQGNHAVHSHVADIDAATQKNIAAAMHVVKELYNLLCLLYGKPDGHDFDEKLVPFDEYLIDRKVHSPEERNRESFFVYKSAPHPRYYYLQCLSFQEEIELEQRREEASERVYRQSRNRGSRLLLPDMEISLPVNSDRKIIAYKAFDDSFLLSENKTPMPVKQALKIGLDLIDALEELKDMGIHHRNIFPGCILIDKDHRGNYEAYLMNLQTSKIIDSSVTVNALLAASHDQNLYIPHFLRSKDQDTNWEKVDVYALCRVVLFCMNPMLAHANNANMFAQYPNLELSASLRSFYSKFFRQDPLLRNIPTLEALREVFWHEYTSAL